MDADKSLLKFSRRFVYLLRIFMSQIAEKCPIFAMLKNLSRNLWIRIQRWITSKI